MRHIDAALTAFSVMLATFLVAPGTSAALSATPQQLARSGSQQHVSVDSTSLLVGSEETPGDFDLLRYSLSTAQWTPSLASGTGQQWEPALSGRLAVYVDQTPADLLGGVPASSKVMAIDLQSGQTHEVSNGDGLRTAPTVFHGVAIWIEVQGGDTGALWMRDLDLDDNDVPDFVQPSGPALAAAEQLVAGPDVGSPSLGAAGLVFSREIEGGDTEIIRIPDLSSPLETQLSSSTGLVDPRPQTAGDLLCWSERVDGDEQIRVTDSLGATERMLGFSDSSSRIPSTDGRWVAWVDDYFGATPVVRAWDSTVDEVHDVRTALGPVSEVACAQELLAWVEVVVPPSETDAFFVDLSLDGGSVDPPDPEDPATVTTVFGSNRYSTAVTIARRAYDSGNTKSWEGVDHIVLASGDDAHLVDSLPASSLCWMYDAPLFLVSSVRSGNVVVRTALSEIAAANPGAQIHIVGGQASFANAEYDALVSGIPGLALAPDRIEGTTRYSTAAAVSRRVRTESGANGKSRPTEQLLAAAQTEGNLFDALALSALGARRGAPILLTTSTELPQATRAELLAFDPQAVVIAGGPAAVTSDVKADIDSATGLTSMRWWGANRYATSVQIAENAIGRGWLSGSNLGIAATLPDALAGGGDVGRGPAGGPLLTTKPYALSADVATWIKANAAEVEVCTVYGGPSAVSPAVSAELTQLLSR